MHCALCILVMHNLWHLKWRAHIQTIADLLPLRNSLRGRRKKGEGDGEVELEYKARGDQSARRNRWN